MLTVGRAKVGVVRAEDGEQMEQWAAYRHPDGIVVYVAQAREAQSESGTLKPLKDLPLSAPELAALAVDDRFHLS